ncbi:hypothetical protein [Herbiconiux sp. UC225_62]|uniref:hypothetical protein n=1 Tax=Herbiconiux sp. UC225_62 TaxID=3350168 RepID=UPI0036D252F4
MSITEQAELTIAEVEVNDGYRVELAQLKKRTDCSPEQAVELAAELTTAASRAIALQAEHGVQQALRDLDQGLIAADRAEAQSAAVDPEMVDWEPKWQAPLVRASCPSCGLTADRRASTWAGRLDGGARVTLSCSRSPELDVCWRVWTLEVPADAGVKGGA